MKDILNNQLAFLEEVKKTRFVPNRLQKTIKNFKKLNSNERALLIMELKTLPLLSEQQALNASLKAIDAEKRMSQLTFVSKNLENLESLAALDVTSVYVNGKNFNLQHLIANTFSRMEQLNYYDDLNESVDERLEDGEDVILISNSFSDCSAICEPWQGQKYSPRKNMEYPHYEDALLENGGGFGHNGCRHLFTELDADLGVNIKSLKVPIDRERRDRRADYMKARRNMTEYKNRETVAKIQGDEAAQRKARELFNKWENISKEKYDERTIINF